MTEQSELMHAPPHVPAELIVDFDYQNPKGLDESDIYSVLKRLHYGKPDILWSPHNGGHWIVSRSDDVRWVRKEANIFSHEEFFLPAGSMNMLMPPSNIDPPYHARFRAVLNPSFAPSKVRTMAESTRALAVELIDKIKAHGSCEFQRDFARVMPVVVFLRMLELPTDRRTEFLRWAASYVRPADQDERDEAAAKIMGFMREVLGEREANPGDDMFSRIVAFRKNPRFQSEDEVTGMAMNTFLGGLDTVSSVLTFTAHHLATHPEARQRVIAAPAIIPQAAEEYLRRFAVISSGRVIKEDVIRKGVKMHKGDYALVIDPLAAVDERIWPNPMEIDFDRDTRVHDTFGNGVHRCLGEHLARMEIIIFLEEWLRRIPDFRLDPAVPPTYHGGVVVGISQLRLLWDS